MSKVVSLAENTRGEFGIAHRSSAIFWFKNNDTFKTTISFINYWKLKNNVDVMIVASIRKMTGDLVTRSVLEFDDSNLINLVPSEIEEGSIEIEAFGNTNLRIPYAAIMAVYEASSSINMVHSYSRTYSSFEVEEGRAFSDGDEGCWSIFCDSHIKPFAVLHNGDQHCSNQVLTATITNSKNQRLLVKSEEFSLRPFESFIVDIEKMLPSLEEFLGGAYGNCGVQAKTQRSFTRMLCGNIKRDWSEFQCSHSNFNYESYATDMVSGEAIASMVVPKIDDLGIEPEVVVYPESTPGHYQLTTDSEILDFKNRELVGCKIGRSTSHNVSFRRLDGLMPTRLVTGIRLSNEKRLASECSLGTTHADVYGKSSHWLLLSNEFSSKIYLTAFPSIYGSPATEDFFELTIYAAGKSGGKSKRLFYRNLEWRNCSLNVVDLFGINENDFFYVFVKSSYRGAVFYSSLAKAGSMCIEHSF